MSYEVELISALKSNDISKLQESFKNIYEAYYKLVYFCVGNFLKNKEDIEDVTQEVFINFFNNLENINVSGSIKYYLTRSARNLSINYLKKNSKVINDYDLSNKASYELKTNDLFDFIKSNLDNDEKEIIIRQVLEGYSLKEIAKITYQNINTVKSKYRRALLKLKHLLKEKNLWKTKI